VYITGHSIYFNFPGLHIKARTSFKDFRYGGGENIDGNKAVGSITIIDGDTSVQKTESIRNL
jgi:hypothetical protein